jgi:isopentenyl diphosphate isomerase/L-lactate dehydrogenase-like FMN-dependent dehydrogenase
MRVAMALTACTSIAEIDEQVLDREGNQPAF